MDKKLNDVEHVKELIDLATEAGLSGSMELLSMPTEDIAANYNGIGPECLSEEGRRKLTKVFKFHEAACLIHDVVRFAKSDGTSARFNEANDELERNGYILADFKCAWYNPMRYWHHRGARIIAKACRVAGWSAWMDAYKARTGKQ
ncbi:MAG: hypothetical protein K6G91_02045 [Kiritimatiellae bacterium]|nr:hypothetical protein [Kiritimatiellia bacterium]